MPYLLLGSSGLNCEFIRREYGFPINLKISFMSSSDKPILTCRLPYIADCDIKSVLLGQSNFE